jgi:hypothetical protein
VTLSKTHKKMLLGGAVVVVLYLMFRGSAKASTSGNSLATTADGMTVIIGPITDLKELP